MMRIALFLLTNLAVIVVASITLSLLGVNSYLAQSGTGLDLGNLLIFSAVFGFAGSFISLLISKPMAKWSARVQTIKQPSNNAEKWLLDTVRELSDKAGIKMPEVGVFPAQQSNAFATGWNKNDALVAVSQGLLQRFRPEEARAVLAHEIGHVANGDMVTLSLIQGVVNTFVIFAARVVGSVVDSFLRRDGNGGLGFGYYIVVFVAEIIFGIAASTIVMWFSRRREYRADVAGAQLADRRDMISALQRLKAESEVPNQMPDSLVAFGINSGVRHGLAALFRSHPPLDDRIQALNEKRYG
ncbi:protease HtpX [Alloalcanivorax gelatiniphagus]|uniref:Protease HtpX n=1 Tax=Alloalcanivorax gelatiniphagus TaxID=1194167 RepID=A0ABY2XM52_9GAMM|nr:protease HtpX [Alloalcanivorax gelatiniphagus]TMW13376.1 protease HtpX [Alloalcanivorax gelatiniphagus]|tara:strand:+ start:5604 stop:6500 length:897 start_codon:yes stop_codon:yes gene_type:complete